MSHRLLHFRYLVLRAELEMGEEREINLTKVGVYRKEQPGGHSQNLRRLH